MYDITKRRTIRKYSDKEIDDRLLHSLLQRAEQTQTMGNLQLYSVVVNRTPEMKAKLAPAHFYQPMVEQAPVVLTFCADYNRCTKWCLERKATPGYDNFHLAEEEGLGLCFLGTTIYNAQQIIDALQLPRLVMPVATITLGWPDEDAPVSDRLPLEAIVHEETYAPYTTEAINAYYSIKESLEENKHFVEINNKETLAQVFTDCRYKAEDCRAISHQLVEVLKKQGFLY